MLFHTKKYIVRIKKMEILIKECADIKNIVVEKTFHKFIVNELQINEQDICTFLDNETCERTTICAFHKNNCIGKHRLISMHMPRHLLQSKKYNIKFEVLDSMYLSKIQLTTSSIEIYYCMVKSTNTNNIYILFSSGIVLLRNELQKNKELNDRLQILFGKIIGMTKQEPNIKIILGGHSMGAVLSMYSGYLLYKNLIECMYF